MNLDNMTEGQRAEWLATMRYINGSAICSSLLYDLGLLPEQLENPMQAVSMLSVVGHIQKLEQDHAARREACVKARDLFCDHAKLTLNGFVQLPCGPSADVLRSLEAVL